jgi:hypothetical protein
MLSYKRCFFNLFTYFVVEDTEERKKYEGKIFYYNRENYKA